MLTFQGDVISHFILCLFNSFLDSATNSNIHPLCCISGISLYHSIVILLHNLSLCTECSIYISLLHFHLIPYQEPSLTKLVKEYDILSLYLFLIASIHHFFLSEI